MPGSVRLIKIASEINLGKDAIVEFLKGKGFTVDNKPTTLLSEDMVNAIYDKFKKEKKAAETQRQKIEKHKQIRKTGDPKDKDDEIPEHTSVHRTKPEEKLRHQQQATPKAEEKPNQRNESKPDEKIQDEEKITQEVNQPQVQKEVSPTALKEESPIAKEIPAEQPAINTPPVQEIEKTDTPKTAPVPEDKYKVNDVIKLPVDDYYGRRRGRGKDRDRDRDKSKVKPKETREKTENERKLEAIKELIGKPSPNKSKFKGESRDGKKFEGGGRRPENERKTENDRRFDKAKQSASKGESTDAKAQAPSYKEPFRTKTSGRPQTAEADKNAVAGKNIDVATGESKNLGRLDTNQVAPVDDARIAAKKKKKRKKIVEVELDANDPTKLKGLTIVGKIDIIGNKDNAKTGKDRGKDRGKPSIADDDDERINKSKKKVKKGKSGKDSASPLGKIDKKKKKISVRELITNEDVDKAIRQTLSDMGEVSSMSNRNKMKLKKKAVREEKNQIRMEEEAKEANILHITEFVTTSDLAKMMGVTPSEIIMKCMGLGLMVSINQRLDKDTITVIADDYGMQVEFIDEKAIQAIDEVEEAADEVNLLPRSPIVTIMGHVDHGKTSLLDYIRNANVVAGEAGGITQHIGAYRVKLKNGKYISFLDTPGHEAFTAMRARGAQVTDIVILVVSADDSVMPQTVEAISHSLAANVPIIVAINKIDKPDAQPDRIRQQLADHNILVEEWGGKYQCAEISAKKGVNIDTLLDKVLLEAEILDLKANPDRLARGTVIEANMTKGLGPVCTVLVQKGTLHVGDPFVVGHQFGRVRALMDERGNKMEVAGPSIPARVIGLNGLPEAGDILQATESDVDARNIANERQQLRRQQEFTKMKQVTLDDISKKIHDGAIKDLSLIIKGDVGGSVEALSDSLQKLSTDEVRVNIIHKGVGTISESDVMLAVASGAIIIGFQVSPTAHARKLAEKESVDIRQYSIIYDCIDEIKRALEGLLTPELKEDVTAIIEVRKIFKISRLGVIAGCQVMNGKIHRNDKVRLLRDGLPIFTGYIESLKRNKDDVREVDSGYECGISLDGYNDIEIGDVIEGFKVLEIKRKLD